MPTGKDYYDLYVKDKQMSWHKIADYFNVCMATPWTSARRYATREGLPWPPCKPEDPRYKKSLDSNKTWRTRRAKTAQENPPTQAAASPTPTPTPEPEPEIAPGTETLDLDMLQW